LHTLVGAGSAEGFTGRRQHFEARAFTVERFSVSGRHHTPANTASPWRKNRSLERRFQSVKVPAPDEEQAVQRDPGRSRNATKNSTPSATLTKHSVIPFIFPTVTFPDRFWAGQAIDLSTKPARA